MTSSTVWNSHNISSIYINDEKLALQTASSTEEGEVFTRNPHTNRYLQWPCNYPWFHVEKEHSERRGAPYLML